jgi:hypothetical protein
LRSHFPVNLAATFRLVAIHNSLIPTIDHDVRKIKRDVSTQTSRLPPQAKTDMANTGKDISGTDITIETNSFLVARQYSE